MVFSLLSVREFIQLFSYSFCTAFFQKSKVGDGNSSKHFAQGDVKYIDNFENPYVRIIIVCKVCSKEQSIKHQSSWKRHYLTHASDENKPFKCDHCTKAFVQKTALNSHMKKHVKEGHQVKEEYGYE